MLYYKISQSDVFMTNDSLDQNNQSSNRNSLVNNHMHYSEVKKA